uniref:Uncharacterized protein n=1 Tax=Anguilla anguilla TaxID=7936 RepID=A0A0E9Q2K1_ANGAN
MLAAISLDITGQLADITQLSACNQS